MRCHHRLFVLALALVACRRTTQPLRLLPTVAHTLPAPLEPREEIAYPGVRLSTTHRFANHGRGRVACQYDPLRQSVVCATDRLSPDWHTHGTRLLRIDPATFTVTERALGDTLHSSFLWGDFNEDGAPDVWAFSDELDDATERAVLYLGDRHALWRFTATHPLTVDHPVLGGAIVDADGDGHEDLLLLGTGYEFQRDRPVTYFRDAVYRGDGRGHFALANHALGLDTVEDFEGHTGPARLGRVAVVTDLNGDHCADLVIGTYRAHRDTFLRATCHGRYEPWNDSPDHDPSRTLFGHAVALAPWDTALRGRLDLYVFNLWHPDWRGAITDPSYVLRGTTRDAFSQTMEAPFGATVADFDGDRRAEVMLATGTRGPTYEGAAVVLREGRAVWRDESGWLRMREVASAVDANLDGAVDVVGDGRVMASHPMPTRRWVGFVFEGRSVSGCVVELVDQHGGRAAFSVASDGRGMPSNLLTVGLGTEARPRRLRVYRGVDGAAWEVALGDAHVGHYVVVTVPR